jgi:hypothetical protein
MGFMRSYPCLVGILYQLQSYSYILSSGITRVSKKTYLSTIREQSSEGKEYMWKN